MNPYGIPIEPGDSIAEAFARRVAASPRSVAYRDFDGTAWIDSTWEQVAAAVNRARDALAKEKLLPGSMGMP